MEANQYLGVQDVSETETPGKVSFKHSYHAQASRSLARPSYGWDWHPRPYLEARLRRQTHRANCRSREHP